MSVQEWGLFSVDRLREIIDELGLELPNGATPQNTLKADLVTFLQSTPFTIQQVCGVTNNHTTINHQILPPNNPKLDVKQGEDEDLLDFLRRLETTFDLHQVPDTKKVPLLQVSLTPKISQHLCDLDGNTLRDYALTKAALLESMKVSRFHHLEMFENAVKLPNETFRDFATRLMRTHALYQGLPLSDILQNPQAKTLLEGVVLPKLLRHAPNEVQKHIKVFAASNREFSEVLTQFDVYMTAVETTQKPKQNRPSNPTRFGTSSTRSGNKFCRNHGLGGHSTDECKGLKPRPRDATKMTCFKCNQVGHIASRCPQPDQGNN